MIARFGEALSEISRRFIPDSFVFALTLTIVTEVAALLYTDVTIIESIEAWYNGFWMLLEFGMQMVLILITGYSIALSSQAKKSIYHLTRFIQTPNQVYPFVILLGMLLSLISWSWMVITAVMARELALRINGINYPYLIACVYFSGTLWVSGLSSTIPLLLNTEGNFLIESEILSATLSTTYTLGSVLNISVLGFSFVIAPILFRLLSPKVGPGLKDLLYTRNAIKELTIEEEAKKMTNAVAAISDKLNNHSIFQYLVSLMGGTYIVFHFSTKGFDINLNIMIFIFVVLGLLLHKTPIQYGIAMKRASLNISGILFQFPFYAGIMGIMMYTGLGKELAEWMTSISTIDTYPLLAYLSGAIVNFAIPSAGGEFAVIGPSIINAVNEIGQGLSAQELDEMIARAALSVAYGESLTNCLQPFYLLIILPIMGAGIRIQARDIMGYLILPFMVFFVGWAIMVVYLPL